MKKILVAGSTGVLGQEVLKLLAEEPYYVRALVRNPDKQSMVEEWCDEIVVGDVTNLASIRKVCEGIDIVFSCIGINVSIFQTEPHSFYDVDYMGNLHLLREAEASGVKRFVFVSIFGSESSDKREVGWSQELFSQQLIASELSYTIIKPVGLFSGMHDLLMMGKSGILVMPGNGAPLTNPIHQKDLAQFCLEHLETGPEIVEVGGPEIHSRQETLEMLDRIMHTRLLINIPTWLVKLGLPFFKIIGHTLYHKLKQFTFITTHDMVAPKYGKMLLEPYMKQQYESKI